MTIDNKFGAGVTYAAPIDLAAKKPLDSRSSVNTIDERDAHVTNNRAYPGMQVYVTETSKTYIYDGESWEVLSSSETGVVDTMEALSNEAVLSVFSK